MKEDKWIIIVAWGFALMGIGLIVSLTPAF